MDEVMGLLETELSALLTINNVVDCPVLPGAATGDRPDEYVSAVSVESEYRAGNAYIVEMEFRSVLPLDDAGALARAKRRLRAVVDFVQSDACFSRTGAFWFGRLVLRNLFSQVGERSRAECVRARFAAESKRDGLSSIRHVVS